MGASNSISEQKKINEEFSSYVEEQTKKMKSNVSDAKEKIKEQVDKHYSTFPDRVELLTGEYSHLSTLSEWSLDGVSKMIGQIKDALFGLKSPPAGTTKGDAAETVSKSIVALAEFEVLVAAAAFEVIQGVLQGFSSGTSTDVISKIGNKKIAPGVNLFISVLESTYKRSDFFSGDVIIQNMYVFEVHFSTQEGAQDSKRETLKVYMDEKETWINQIEKVTSAIDKLDPENENYLNSLQRWSSIIDSLHKNFEPLDKKIENLSKNEKLNALRSSRSAIHNIVSEKAHNLLAFAKGGHGKCWLVANGDDGNKYYAFVRKYSDAHETAFKRAVISLAGGCRSVHRSNSEPDTGTELFV